MDAKKNRGRFISWWNASHNIGAILAGPIALFGMEYAFNGNVAGMFIFPILFAGVIATFGMFFGKDDPSELGWNTPEEIFDEPISKDDTAAESMSKSEIFVKYVLKNPAVWFYVLPTFVFIPSVLVLITGVWHMSKWRLIGMIFPR